jgi:D-glycero-D-manno-heptose 1,7-bisphosphate phosphatase
MSGTAIERSCTGCVYRGMHTSARPLTVKKNVAQVEVFRPVPSRNPKTCGPQLYCPQQSRLTAPIARNPNRRAVFLDRDGTVVEDVGYLTDPSQLKLLPGVVDGIRLLQDQFLIVIVTNQSAIARGLLDEDGLLSIHQELATALYRRGAFLDAIYACPHHPHRAQCHCRKPQPGMLLRARDDFDIRLGSSFMIGDKGSDIVAGQQGGVAATILIASRRTDSGLPPDIRPTYVASNLFEAAQLILDHWASS